MTTWKTLSQLGENNSPNKNFTVRATKSFSKGFPKIYGLISMSDFNVQNYSNGTFKKQIRRLWEIAKKYKLALSFLLLFAIGNLTIAIFSSQSRDELLEQITLNLATEIFAFILIFFLLESGLERIQELDYFRIRAHDRLPIDEYRKQINNASNFVQLLDSYTLLINKEAYWPSFKVAFETALENGAQLSILLCDPRKEGAQERAKEIVNSDETNYSDVEELLTEFHLGIVKLSGFVREMEVKQQANSIQVKLMSVRPAVTLHLADNNAYWSFFPKDKLATFSEHLGMPRNSQLGVFLNDEFDRYWTRPSNISIEQYLQETSQNHIP